MVLPKTLVWEEVIMLAQQTAGTIATGSNQVW